MSQRVLRSGHRHRPGTIVLLALLALLAGGCFDLGPSSEQATVPDASADADGAAADAGAPPDEQDDGDTAQPQDGGAAAPEAADAGVGAGDEATDGGTTYTAAELAVWRQRARSGPYRVDGDAGSNTPGDWERIEDNTREFAQDPDASHLVADFSGCATGSKMGPEDRFGQDLRGAGGKFESSVELRDAAFYALVENDGALAQKVLAQLVRQAEEPTLDFSDARKWCPVETNADAFDDTEFLFPLSSYLVRLLYAYDYAAAWATPGQKDLLDAWHENAATYVSNSVHRSDDLWEDAAAGRYVPTESAGYDYPQWRGGRDTSRYGRHYNNRQAINVMYVAAAGVHLADRELTAIAQRWSKEFVRYSVYPDGTVAELERGRSGAERGMNYANKTVGTLVLIADLLARHGDTSVYDYTSSDGIFGTAGGSKSLRTAIAGADTMYRTDGRIATGGGDYGDTDRQLATDAVFAVGQRYYRDATLDRLLDRSWPSDPRHSWASPWQGPWGVLPGALFQYHDLPTAAADPYR